MRTATRLSSFALVLLACVAAALGQTSQGYLNDLGNTPYGINIPVENGFINISNGNLHLEFPIASPPQRGALGLNERLVYDSRVWMFLPFGSNGSYHWWPYNVNAAGGTNASGGWRFIKGNEVGSISLNEMSYQAYECDPNSSAQSTSEVDQILWTDPTGTTHPFNATQNYSYDACQGTSSQNVNWGIATDGSGYSASDDGTGNPVVLDNSGNQVYPQVIDRYGNYLGGGDDLVDDTGRVPVLTTHNGNTTYYDVLAPNGPINNQGTRVRYTVMATPMAVSSNFQDWSNSDIHQWCNQCPEQNDINLFVPVTSIQLPDGSQYTFGYDTTGELTNVTLPTGGTVSYGYSNIFDSSNTENRWLTSRTVGSNPAMTFTPSVVTGCSNYGTGCVEQVTLHKPSGDETVYQLSLINGAWNTGVTAYNGSVSGGQQLSSVTTVDKHDSACNLGSFCAGQTYVSLSTSTKTLYGSQNVSSQTQTALDPSVGKITALKEWGYGTDFNGTPTRETDYIYSGFDVQQVTVLNSSGNTAGQTTYNYTTTPAQTTSGVAQHGAQNAGGPYLQTVSHLLIGGNPSVMTYGMDDTGQVVSTSDPNGNPSSTVSYQCANSLPYQTTNPLGQTTQYTYDCNSGAVAGVQDPNDLANNRSGTTYTYEGAAGRPQRINSPDGGQTSYSYPSSTEVDTTVLATPNPSIASQDFLDSFGRKYQHVQAGVSSEISYDANGRLSCTSNPHTGSGSSTDGSTCITLYDGLDRPLTQQQPDGATLGWSYNGATVSSSDETGRQWQRTSDAFGHLIKVVEPNAWTTQYTYDALGNLQVITQGDGVTRTFIHDSLSRLINECHPEAIAAGQTCSISGPWSSSYTLDANGNARTKTDARGVQINYTFDALNRLTNAQSSGAGGVPGFNYTSIYDVINGQYNAGYGTNGVGRLVVASNNVDADQVFSYDAMGRMTQQGNWTPSSPNHTSQVVSSAYDLAGNLTSLTYPDGRTIKQGFQGDGNLHSVTFDNWQGNGVGYSYLSSASYFPDGSPMSMTFGNGVTQSYGRNNRLQTSEIRVANGSTTFFDKQFCHGPNNDPTAPLCTASNGANNGNIQQILDAQNGANSQGFSYDGINRLASFSNGSGTMQQGFGFPPYAGMQIGGGGSPKLDTNQANGRFSNLPCASSLQPYDNAGNQLCDSDTNGANRVYSFDGNDQVASVTMQNGGQPFVSYDYLPDGNRVRKSTSDGNWTEYIYFGGQTIAEKTQDGSWSDYIYANGQKIARADSFDQRIHISGTHCTNCGWQSAAWDLPLSGYTVKNGDKVSWRQYQAGTAVGGYSIQFSDSNNTNTNWNTKDTNGQVMNNLTVSNQWVNRTVDLSPYAGLTIGVSWVGVEGQTGDGNWDEFYSDMAITSADGTVTPIYTRQPAMGLSYFGTSGMTNLNGRVERINTVGDAVQAQLNTTYYHGDQLGSARLTTSGGGWATTSDTFYPFGLEPGGPAGPGHFQYAGLERDPETGLDHATFRQYSSSTGRWMSPDPYDGSMDLGNPQSLNRYNYAGNNPLRYTDPTGLFGQEVAVPVIKVYTSICLNLCATGFIDLLTGPAGWIAGGIEGAFELAHLLGAWNHPTYHGPKNTRPNVQNKCGPGGANLTAPPGTNFAANAQLVRTAAAASLASGPGAYASVLAGYAAAVWPGVGPWDYKKGLPPGSLRDSYTDAGNYNYGVTCGALGLSAGACGNAAGQATRISNGGQLQGPGGYNSYPYGDQERDEQWVQKGYSDYASGNVCKVP